VLQGANNFASIADLLFTSTVSNATAEELGYIEANKTAFAAAEAAEATSYTAAKESLTTAIAALDAAYAAGQGSYTDESWAAFEKAYLAAKAGLTSANYSSTLATLQTKLEAAKAGLAVKQTTSDSTVKDPVTQTPVNDANNGTTLKVGDTVTKGGVVYKVTNVAKKTAAAVKGKNAKAKSVKIADTVTINGVSCKVTQINAKAFKNYTSLKKVTIGKNVTTIGKQSFYNCKKLAKVTFKGTAVKSIKSGAFKKTSDKLKITLAKSLKGKKRTKLTKLLKKAGISKKATIK
jgi:hypothetical protein